MKAHGKDAKFQNLMEQNDGGSIFVGWGMPIASKRAKEHQNRSSDELVMGEKKSAEAESGRGGCTARVGSCTALGASWGSSFVLAEYQVMGER